MSGGGEVRWKINNVVGIGRKTVMAGGLGFVRGLPCNYHVIPTIMMR
jgi:hypothetical protein